MSIKYYKHQEDTIKFCANNNDHVMIGSDAGTGKTMCVLERIKAKAPKPGEFIAVLAPKSIVRTAWEGDMAKVNFPVPYFVGLSSAKAKIKAINEAREAGGILLTNHQTVFELLDNAKGLKGIIVDESTAFKNRTAKQTKAMLKLSKRDLDLRIPMSGTPTPQTVMDLWSQIEIARPGFLPPYFKLRGELQYPSTIQVGGGRTAMQWKDRPDADVWLAQMLEPVMIRYAKHECLDLPEQTLRTIKVQLSKKLRAIYDQFAKDAILELEGGDAVGVNAAVVAQKLLQITSGFVYGDDMAHNLSPERYELVVELIEERRHSLVACPLREQMRGLSVKLKSAGITHTQINGDTPADERAKIIEDYQDGKYQTLLCSPKALSHGATLTRADTIIWASPVRSTEEFAQFNARIDRIGQDKKNEVIMIAADDTYEIRAYELLMTKVNRQLSLLDLLGD